MDEIILQEYSSGLSISEIARIHNTTNHLIRKIITSNNIEVRTNSFNSRRYTLNENLFDSIDNENKAYWLGFLYADGSISSNSNDIYLALSVVDINHLVKFALFLETNRPIKTYPKKVGTDYSRMIANSKHMKESLIRLGCTPRKSETLVFPELREDLIFHFIRGYFDGDGSITYVSTQNEYKFRVCGTYEMMTSIKSFLEINNPLRQRWPERGINNWDIDIGGNIQVYRKLKLLYENSTIYLDRKFERFCRLRSLHVERYE